MNEVIKFINEQEIASLVGKISKREEEEIDKTIQKIKVSILDYQAKAEKVIYEINKKRKPIHEGKCLICIEDYQTIKKGTKVLITRIENNICYINAMVKISIEEVFEHFENIEEKK